jgi:hypothetical protein
LRGEPSKAHADCFLNCGVGFSNRLEDQDGERPVRTLPVNLEAAVLADKEWPEAFALLGSCLAGSYLPYFWAQLNLRLWIGAKVEVPRRVVLLPGVRRDRNDRLPFPETLDRCGPGVAALPPGRREQDHGAA